MSSWEEIANEVAPAGFKPKGLMTGAHRRALMDAQPPQAEHSSEGARIAAPLSPRLVGPPPCAPDCSLDGALQGIEAENEAGKFYRIVRAAREFDAVFENLAAHLDESVEFIARRTRTPTQMRDLLFMDIETTGLSSSTPLFLIGTLREENSVALLELFLARGFEEERAALHAFHQLCDGKTLVTFNGKSFDWPYIEGRSLRGGIKNSTPRAHFDLLHHARRKWKPLVPNCRLQTLEYYLCNRKRDGDIASSRIPDQYLEFAERFKSNGRGAHLLAPIVHHNAWDVLTMADLLRRIQQ
jgi:uncharacterized protein YprB with RNaseH-like and TPR domain